MLDFLDTRGTVIRHFTSRLDSVGVVDSLRADSVKKARADSITKAGGLAKTPNPQLGSAALKTESGIGSPGGEPEVDFEETHAQWTAPAARAEQGGAQHLRLEPARTGRGALHRHDPLGRLRQRRDGPAGHVPRAADRRRAAGTDPAIHGARRPPLARDAGRHRRHGRLAAPCARPPERGQPRRAHGAQHPRAARRTDSAGARRPSRGV